MSSGEFVRPPRLVDLLGELLPERREWRTFLLDLVPLLGFFFFADSVHKLVLPVVAELLFLEAAAYVRIAAHAFARASDELREWWPETWGGRLLFVMLPGPMLAVVGGALLLIVIGFNKVLFLMAEGCLSLAIRKDPDLSYVQLISGLGDVERVTFAGLCAGAALRAIGGLVAFFQGGRYRGGGAGWLFLGWPSIDPENRMRRTLRGLGRWWEGLGSESGAPGPERRTSAVVAELALSFAIVPALVVVPLMGFASSLGAAWIIVAKAFLELWVDRLLAPRTTLG